MDPRPIILTQIDAEDFGGTFDPQPYVVVGPMPGGGGGATGGIQTVRPGENVLIDDSDPENIVIAAMGSSAYNEWIKQGNTGTEEDFLSSLRGEKGERGDKGDRGDQGIQGIPGPEGAAGENGPKGDAGQSITIEDYLDSEAELTALEATLAPADAGKSYITIDTGHLYFWNGTGFNDAGMVVGAKGADGINGQPGVQGIQGEQGIPGTKGDKGDVGDAGPRGLQGAQGLPGVRGLTGEQGIPGTVGAKGDPGDIGPKGDQGDTGFRGLQGIAGAPGQNGSQGAKGDKGDAGETGPRGLGFPTGGTAGQIPVKQSSLDGDVLWQASGALPSNSLRAPIIMTQAAYDAARTANTLIAGQIYVTYL